MTTKQKIGAFFVFAPFIVITACVVLLLSRDWYIGLILATICVGIGVYLLEEKK